MCRVLQSRPSTGKYLECKKPQFVGLTSLWHIEMGYQNILLSLPINVDENLEKWARKWAQPDTLHFSSSENAYASNVFECLVEILFSKSWTELCWRCLARNATTVIWPHDPQIGLQAFYEIGHVDTQYIMINVYLTTRELKSAPDMQCIQYTYIDIRVIAR